MTNKIKYGLKNVHYAVITETDGAITYGTPTPIPGAVNISLPAAGEEFTFYADDMVYFEGQVNNGYEGDLEMALIPDSFRKDVLQESEDEKGVLFEDSNVFPKPIALLFEFNGDVKQTRHVLYNVSVARPSVESGTKTNTIEPKTDTLSLKARPAKDTGYVKSKTTAATDAQAYADWYNTVHVFAEPAPGA